MIQYFGGSRNLIYGSRINRTMDTILTVLPELQTIDRSIHLLRDFFSTCIQEKDIAVAEVSAEFPMELSILNFFVDHRVPIPCVFSMGGDIFIKHAIKGLTGDMYDPVLDFHLWFAPIFSRPGKPTLRTSALYEVNLQFPLSAESRPELATTIAWLRSRSFMLTGENPEIKRSEIWDGTVSVVLMIEGHTHTTARILFHEAIERQSNPAEVLVDYQIACDSPDDYKSLKSNGLLPFCRTATSKLYFDPAEINPNFGPNPFAISSLTDSVPLLEALNQAGCQSISLSAGCLISPGSGNLHKDDLPYISTLLQFHPLKPTRWSFTISNPENAANPKYYVPQIKNWASKNGMAVKKVQNLS